MVTCYSTRNQARYSSSLTFSSHSTYLPSSPSCMAMCEIAVVEVAPCQCFSRGGHQTMSPARISTFGPPSLCTQPQPRVTTSVCPSGCQCQAERAPGSKVTSAQLTRAGSCACISGSMRTEPVKYSSGPFCEGREPFLLSSIFFTPSFRFPVGAAVSRLDHDFQCLALVHRTVAVGHAVEVRDAVEDAPRSEEH